MKNPDTFDNTRESCATENYDPACSMIKRQLILNMPSTQLINADRN